MRRRRPSAPLRAASIKPTGSPLPRGSGNEIAQRSKKFISDVLRRRIVFLGAKVSSVATSAILGATIGVVGKINASNPAIRSSIARTRILRSRCISM